MEEELSGLAGSSGVTQCCDWVPGWEEDGVLVSVGACAVCAMDTTGAEADLPMLKGQGKGALSELAGICCRGDEVDVADSAGIAEAA